ncbi:hypothetical protein [Chelativorans alearense]|uniref:hypothetical protein n=1 Tax=Chelativorans alearense TaxID=2681495 RepID=UPI0013D10975|nr:hypothetical protein [Chelativorans alearense]
MRIRIIGPLVVAAVLAAGHAGASSILELEAMELDTAAEAAPGEAPVAISTSVSIIGEPEVTFESTAAVKKEDRRRFDPAPLVIRGGLAGDPFVHAAPKQPASAAPRQASAPAAAAPAPAAPPSPVVRRPE